MVNNNRHTIFTFENIVKTKELEITAKEFLGGRYHNPSSSYLHEEDIVWVLNTIRGVAKGTYLRGGIKEKRKKNDSYFILLSIGSGDDRDWTGLVDIFIQNEEHSYYDEVNETEITGSGFGIAFDSKDPMNPEDSLYKFLEELETYVPEEEKNRIIAAWR